jgi:hypothetical protein
MLSQEIDEALKRAEAGAAASSSTAESPQPSTDVVQRFTESDCHVVVCKGILYVSSVAAQDTSKDALGQTREVRRLS